MSTLARSRANGPPISLERLTGTPDGRSSAQSDRWEWSTINQFRAGQGGRDWPYRSSRLRSSTRDRIETGEIGGSSSLVIRPTRSHVASRPAGIESSWRPSRYGFGRADTAG